MTFPEHKIKKTKKMNKMIHFDTHILVQKLNMNKMNILLEFLIITVTMIRRQNEFSFFHFVPKPWTYFH